MSAVKTGFQNGAFYGAIAGTGSALYFRKLMHIPYFAMAAGTAYAAYLGT